MVRARSRRSVFLILTLFAAGASVAALASEREAQESAAGRPVAVDPAPELPSAEYLELRAHAIPQPAGHLDGRSAPVASRVASPSR